MTKKYLVSLAGLFLILFGCISILAPKFPEYDSLALHAANLLLAVLSLLSFFMVQRKLKEGRPQAFVNGVYSATLLRLMVCLGGIFLYAYTNKEQLHKPSVFAMMGLYFLYTALETMTASRVAKK